MTSTDGSPVETPAEGRPERPQRSRDRSRAERAGRTDGDDTARTQQDGRAQQDGRPQGDADRGRPAPRDDDRDQGESQDRSGRTRNRGRDDDREQADTQDRGGRNRGRDDDRDQGDSQDRGGRTRNRGRDDDRDQADTQDRGGRTRNRGRDDDRDQGESADRNDPRNDSRGDRSGNQQGPDGGRNRGDRPGNRPDGRADNRPDNRPDTRGDAGPEDDDDEFDGNGRRRGRRYRDRNRRGGTTGGQGGSGRDRYDQGEPAVSDDDVLLPVAGILDVLDNYAFVRTSGYLTGPNDVYVSLSQVRRYGLRRGDAITGAVRQPREGERKDKYNALVRLDSVNGLDPEQARTRPEFTKLVPLYPQERLRMETDSTTLTTRVIDLVMPIGKGQRALIVSPPKAGKTMVLQAIANAITTNNPECHLMVVLVDERPEEVTDMQRSVKGEVIASTFDRPATDHTTVAELSIERAKRLVEMGHDVVVLLDSITRLGRAYNLAAPASGRILSGGVDSTALYPPKRFLGAARNIENGGSLTIIASALVETGSTMDTVIFEEFKGTGNAEIKLDRRLADKRVFPAVDVNASSTRKEELLMSPDEQAIVIKLRRVLAALEPQQAIELLLGQLKKTRNNIEFLMQVQKTTLGAGRDD
ncbi:transcription termination factor Rho [Klenkia terrae]|uniref:transcription termination factor Rho n=1 Tax=Klenkia terrae TaxID=1052259 RepID=UPI001CD9035F|nr:transcription termination factor Rho [Klenkia terrae]